MKLWCAVDGFCLEGYGESRVGGIIYVLERVDGAVGGVMQTPRAAEIYDLDAAGEEEWGELTGGLMGEREEDQVDFTLLDEIPMEGVDRGERLCGAACELRVQLLKWCLSFMRGTSQKEWD